MIQTVKAVLLWLLWGSLIKSKMIIMASSSSRLFRCLTESLWQSCAVWKRWGSEATCSWFVLCRVWDHVLLELVTVFLSLPHHIIWLIYLMNLLSLHPLSSILEVGVLSRSYLHGGHFALLWNMLFYLEMWFTVPPDFHYPSSSQLLIDIIPANELPTLRVNTNMVYCSSKTLNPPQWIVQGQQQTVMLHCFLDMPTIFLW